MGRLANLLKSKRDFTSSSLLDEKEKTYTSQSDLARKAVEETPATFKPNFQTTGDYTPTTQPKSRLSELIKRDTKLNPRQQFAKDRYADKQAEKERIETQEAARKKTLPQVEDRLDFLLGEAKTIEQSPEPDATKQTALTEDILKTRNLITANQPGFKSGLRESVGLDPTAKFSAQQATEERAEASELAKQEATTQKGFTTGKVVGELGKQAALYATIGSAIKGTDLGMKLVAKFGGGAKGKFVSNQIIDLLVDTVIQTPQEILRDDSLGKIGINRLIDVGMNLFIGGAVDGIPYLKSLKKSNPDAVADAVVKSDVVDKKSLLEKLGFTNKERQPILERLGLDKLDDTVKATDEVLDTVKQADEAIDVVKQVDDVGYHYGDLGKAEFGKEFIGGNRDTGHYGTGTYFVGSEDAVKGSVKSNRPLNTVDFSEYNLYKPNSKNDGLIVHNNLKKINNELQDYLKDLELSKLSIDELDDIKFSGDENSLKNTLKKYTTEEFDGQIENATDYELDRMINKLIDDVEFAEDGINDFNKIKKQLEKVLNKSEIEIENAVNKTIDYSKNIADDSLSTKLMKELGYDGIDVRGIDGLDNTTYGSVIYDLNPNSISDTTKPITEPKPKLSQMIKEKTMASDIDIPKSEILNQGSSQGRKVGMTFGEFVQNKKNIKSGNVFEQVTPDEILKLEKEYKNIIKEAFEKGEFVPPNVAKQYDEFTELAIKQNKSNRQAIELTPEQKALLDGDVKPKTIASDIEGVKTSAPDQVDLAMPAKIESDLSETIKFKERGFSENVRTDKAMQPEINANFDKDPLFYEELSNMTTLERAQARFDKGFDEALKDFELTKGELKADNVVLAKMLANEAVKNGDMATARRVLSDIAETLTTSGQYSQAAKILRESNDPATILAYIEKELKKLNKQGVKRYGVEKPKLLNKLTGSDKTKGWKEIKLTDDELAKISKFTANTTDADKQVLFEELFDSISTRIPTSIREKIDAWRRISMLFNPKTHIRNVTGNSIMTAVKKASDTLAATGEQLIPKLQRTKSIIKSKASKKIAENYFDANKSDLLEGSRWEIFGVKSPFADKKIFDNKYLEALNTVSKNTLEVEDVVFMKRHFIDDLAGFLDARGLKEPTQEAVDYALKRAQEATFRQQNALADIIAKGKKSRYGLLVEAAVPFSKTPANIAQMGIDYSPIGVVNAVYKLATNQPPAEFIETLSKGLTGTGLAYLGATMASNGMARGSYKTDKSEEALLTKSGQLPNSIQLPTGSYTIDWAQPAAIPFFMGVAFQEELENKDTDIVDAFYQAGVKGVDTIFEQTMLSGIKDIFGGYGSTTEKISELPFDYLMQGLPTVAGQVARTVDPVKRMRDYSGLTSKLETQTKAKTPFKSKELPAKRGMFGEELTYGNGFSNALQQFLSPGYYASKQDDPLTNEMLRLYNEVGSSFLPRVGVKKITSNKVTHNLSTEEQSEFQKVMGEYTEKKLLEAINTITYKNLSDQEKADLFEDINDEGYKIAKENFLKGLE